jgi:hypothetical protein
MATNKNVVLIMGPPNTGKSTALQNLSNQEQMVYLNADLKEIPFLDKFAKSVEIADALSVIEFVNQIEQEPGVTGAVLDTITLLMSMYERQYVKTAVNTQQAWGDYGDFYRSLIHAIKSGSKNYAILAHEDSFLNEKTHQMEYRVPIKGSVGKIGAEADFTNILTTRRVAISELEGHENDLLHITDEEREDGEKCVFVTRPSGDLRGIKSRSTNGLWKRSELYIDNDLEQVFNRIQEFYGTKAVA